eukprot:COSAG05_NODE_3663_length_1920_cov_0.866008_1_plen_92_part_00
MLSRWAVLARSLELALRLLAILTVLFPAKAFSCDDPEWLIIYIYRRRVCLMHQYPDGFDCHYEEEELRPMLDLTQDPQRVGIISQIQKMFT